MDKAFAKRFRDSLLGRPPEAPPPPPLIPLPEMLEQLKQLDDLRWGDYAFSRDPIGGRFPPAERARLTRLAADCGAQWARTCRQQHGAIGARQLAAKLGLSLSEPDTPAGGGRVLFAQFVEPDQITLFRDCLQRAEALLADPDTARALDGLEIEGALIAHEIFHFIETENRESIPTQTERILLWKLGPLRNRSAILCLSEIAAMAFAQEWQRLPYSPYLLDVFLVYAYNPDAACALCREILGGVIAGPGADGADIMPE